MTPARFDLLFAIYTADRESVHWRYASTQAYVRKILGLHPSTVSKAISRLIELKILRERAPYSRGDKRERVVVFTAFGLRVFRLALRIAFGQREIATISSRLKEHVWPATMEPRSRRRWQLHAATYRLLATICSLARSLGDWSKGLYWPRRNGTEDRQSPDTARVDALLRKYERRNNPPIPRRPNVTKVEEAILFPT